MLQVISKQLSNTIIVCHWSSKQIVPPQTHTTGQANVVYGDAQINEQTNKLIKQTKTAYSWKMGNIWSNIYFTQIGHFYFLI